MVGFARNRRRYRVPWQDRYWQGRAKVVAWLRVVLAILACWLLFVVSYLGFAEPASTLIAAARWSAAALLDAIGLGHWTWTIAASDGELSWRSSLIRIDSWHLSQVEAVLASFWTAIASAATATLLGLSLTLAWWLGKRQVAARYQKQPAVPAAQHLAAAGVSENQHGLPVKAGERESQNGELAPYAASPPAALPDDHEQDQSAGQNEKEPDIERLFQQDRGLQEWDEARVRKPVARHKWRYRPC